MKRHDQDNNRRVAALMSLGALLLAATMPAPAHASPWPAWLPRQTEYSSVQQQAIDLAYDRGVGDYPRAALVMTSPSCRDDRGFERLARAMPPSRVVMSKIYPGGPVYCVAATPYRIGQGIALRITTFGLDPWHAYPPITMAEVVGHSIFSGIQ